MTEIKNVDTYYYHTDHLQSASIMTAGNDIEENQAGDKVEDLYYYPYGEVLSDTGSISVKHKFAGHEFDSETGLIYMGARYYDPKLARFITADPVVPARVDQHNFLSFKVQQDLTNPQKLNRYSYCGNNPVVLRDPFGLDWTDYVRTGADWVASYAEYVPGWVGGAAYVYNHASDGYAAVNHAYQFAKGNESWQQAACGGGIPLLNMAKGFIGHFSKGAEDAIGAGLKSFNTTKGIIDSIDHNKCAEMLGATPANTNQVAVEKAPDPSPKGTLGINPPPKGEGSGHSRGGNLSTDVNLSSKSSDSDSSSKNVGAEVVDSTNKGESSYTSGYSASGSSFSSGYSSGGGDASSYGYVGGDYGC